MNLGELTTLINDYIVEKDHKEVEVDTLNDLIGWAVRSKRVQSRVKKDVGRY